VGQIWSLKSKLKKGMIAYMITTTAEISYIDLNSNRCEVRVPLFENVNIGTPAIMQAKICVQPGSFNNYRKGDLV
jgi:hypothetical protein